MSVLFCRRENVSHPFFIENLGIHVYTSQELCYAIYNHPLLALDGFIDQNLVDFIRDELGMGFTALKMERFMKSGENQDELLFLFLQECDYYTTAEINRLRQKVTALRKLPPLEYAKQKADYLFGFKQYGKAIAGYEKILESYLTRKADDAFLGRVWNNLGACYARIFQFDQAMDAYGNAYEKLKDIAVLERMYHLTRMDPSISMQERYQPMVTEERKAAWDGDFAAIGEAADQSEEIRKLEAMFAGDPIRRGEGARQQVEAWKKEYRDLHH